MDELAQCQARITEQQKKLDEIDRRRQELAEAREKRKLEEEKERIKKREEAEVRRKRQKMSLTPARAEIPMSGRVLSCLILERHEQEFDASVSSCFRSAKGHCALLCTGTQEGKLEVWDGLNSFANVTTIELKQGASIFSLLELRGGLQFPAPAKGGKGGKSQRPPKPPTAALAARAQASGGVVSLLVAGSGCDIVLVSLYDLSVVYTIEEAHAYEVQVLASLEDVGGPAGRSLLFSGSLDASIACWDTGTWTCLFQLKGHEDSVLCLLGLPALAGAPGSSRLVSGSDDCTIRVWDVAACLREAEKAGAGGVANVDAAKAAASSSSKDANTDEAGATTNAPVIKKAEHVIRDNSEFVGALCRVTLPQSLGADRAQTDAPSAAKKRKTEDGAAAEAGDATADGQVQNLAAKDEKGTSAAAQDTTDLVVAASADFYIRVYNRAWDCVRVLETSIFATHLVACGSYLFAATRYGEEGDPGKIERWFLPDLNPLAWKRNPNTLTVMPCSVIAARQFSLSRYTGTKPPEGANVPQFAPMLVSADEDEEFVRIWSSPFKIAQPSAAAQQQPQQQQPQAPHEVQTSQPQAQQVATAEAAPNVAAPPTEAVALRVSDDQVVGSTSGDILAKRFLRDLLHIPNLSPDMARLLRVCYDLHVPGQQSS